MLAARYDGQRPSASEGGSRKLVGIDSHPLAAHAVPGKLAHDSRAVLACLSPPSCMTSGPPSFQQQMPSHV
jgi:hypothetical protein